MGECRAAAARPPVVNILYFVISVTGTALIMLTIITPILLRDVDHLHAEWEKDFEEVKKMSNDLWHDLQTMNAKVRTPRDRLRRQYHHFANQPSGYAANGYQPTGYESGYNNRNSGGNGYDEAPYENQQAPVYGYGLARLKCCCAMKNIDYDGEHRDLPISYKCPIGKKGPPGPSGESGEPGRDGQPGYEGEDYPVVDPRFDEQQATFDNGYGGGGPVQPKKSYCEPCPRGPQGLPGSKGPTGVSGLKGDKGIQGIHGIPGIPGNAGQPGEVGARGKSGRPGLPGPRGADGQGGAKGLPGKAGNTGSIGVPGPRGVSGPTGSFGRDGRRGSTGRQGQKGQRGLDGVDGPQGPPGPPGIDAGYCRCPDRVHDVSNAGGADSTYNPAGKYSPPTTGYESLSNKNYNSYNRRPTVVNPPAAMPRNGDELSGSSYQMTQRYGSDSESQPKYDSRPVQSGNYYTQELQINDLPSTAVAGRQGSSTGQSRVHQNHAYGQPPRAVPPTPPSSPPVILPAAQYSPSQDEDEYPFSSSAQDWNEARKRRLQRQRQRYVGRS